MKGKHVLAEEEIRHLKLAQVEVEAWKKTQDETEAKVRALEEEQDIALAKVTSLEEKRDIA